MSSCIFRSQLLLCAIVVLANCAGLRAQDCEPQWAEGLFEFPGPGVNGTVYALAVFDDGSGPALYAGGSFTSIGGQPINGLARWDGESWSEVGGGIEGNVYAFTVFDDGSGPSLYVGGSLMSAGGAPVNCVAKWDGTAWSALDGGIGDGHVAAMTAYDDGTGSSLYAGGRFESAGGVPVENLAKWDGVAWSDVGGGVNGEVSALAVLDNGTGPVLCVGGYFFWAGDVFAENVARWDGAEWTPFGDGLQRQVSALAVYDDGRVPALYGASPYNDPSVQRWDGTAWIAVGDPAARDCEALAAIDLGAGPLLVAGGRFASAGGEYVDGVAALSGGTWVLLGDGPGPIIEALAAFNDGSSPAVYAGGSFPCAGEAVVNGVARWSGGDWESCGGTTDGNGLNRPVRALATFDDGTGEALYVSGAFDTAGTTAVNGIGRWDGSSWSALGNGLRYVHDLAVFDDGTGDALYAGGRFHTVAGIPCENVARWDGQNWSAVGEGIAPVQELYALAVFDDGGGPALYAAGTYSDYSQEEANVYKWDGTSWSALPAPITGERPWICALAGFDDGSGPALYAAGRFGPDDPQLREHIAKWSGEAWVSVGGGVSYADYPASIQSLCVFDDGSGPALYAGGDFDAAGGVPANCVAKWDGTQWSALGDGITSFPFATVQMVTAFADESGPALYIGGFFTHAGGVAAGNIACWNGTQWSALGDGIAGGFPMVTAAAGFDDGFGPALYVGGQFTTAGGYRSNHIARWGCPMITPGDVDRDGDVDLADLARLLAAFNSCAGDPAYNPHADFDDSGCVDSDDLSALLANYGYGSQHPLSQGLDQ